LDAKLRAYVLLTDRCPRCLRRVEYKVDPGGGVRSGQKTWEDLPYTQNDSLICLQGENNDSAGFGMEQVSRRSAHVFMPGQAKTIETIMTSPCQGTMPVVGRPCPSWHLSRNLTRSRSCTVTEIHAVIDSHGRGVSREMDRRR
jgi:hypothetical protein